MTLSQEIAGLSRESMIKLYGDLTDADLRLQNGVDTKPLFKRLRKGAKGKFKRIYAGCKDMKHEEIKTVLDILHREIYEH